jgi:formate dehydrogenase major subunit
VVEPIFESKIDSEIMYLSARKLGFAEDLFKHIAVTARAAGRGHPARDQPRLHLHRLHRDVAERLKLHMKHAHTFDKISMQAAEGPLAGEYYGLPWPCWGYPEWRHPGSPVLYDTSKHVMEGGGTFRARFGVEHEGETLLAEGSYTKAPTSRTGTPSSPWPC